MERNTNSLKSACAFARLTISKFYPLALASSFLLTVCRARLRFSKFMGIPFGDGCEDFHLNTSGIPAPKKGAQHAHA